MEDFCAVEIIPTIFSISLNFHLTHLSKGLEYHSEMQIIPLFLAFQRISLDS